MYVIKGKLLTDYPAPLLLAFHLGVLGILIDIVVEIRFRRVWLVLRGGEVLEGVLVEREVPVHGLQGLFLVAKRKKRARCSNLDSSFE